MSMFLILLASGESKRLKTSTPKPFIKINNSRSAKSNICKLESFSLINPRLIKVKNVNSPNNMQIRDVAITHL